MVLMMRSTLNDHPFHLGQYAPFASIIPAGWATVKGSLKKIFQNPKIRLTDSEKGEIYSTDKSVWMQGRCGWIFSYLCHLYGVKEEWLAAAKSCIDFLEDHCINRAAGGRMYFTVTEDGQPLRQRRYCFSEAFYALANGEYFGVTGETDRG